MGIADPGGCAARADRDSAESPLVPRSRRKTLRTRTNRRARGLLRCGMRGVPRSLQEGFSGTRGGSPRPARLPGRMARGEGKRPGRGVLPFLSSSISAPATERKSDATCAVPAGAVAGESPCDPTGSLSGASPVGPTRTPGDRRTPYAPESIRASLRVRCVSDSGVPGRRFGRPERHAGPAFARSRVVATGSLARGHGSLPSASVVRRMRVGWRQISSSYRRTRCGPGEGPRGQRAGNDGPIGVRGFASFPRGPAESVAAGAVAHALRTPGGGRAAQLPDPRSGAGPCIPRAEDFRPSGGIPFGRLRSHEGASLRVAVGRRVQYSVHADSVSRTRSGRVRVRTTVFGRGPIRSAAGRRDGPEGAGTRQSARKS